MKRLLLFLILALSAHGQILAPILNASGASTAQTPAFVTSAVATCDFTSLTSCDITYSPTAGDSLTIEADSYRGGALTTFTSFADNASGGTSTYVEDYASDTSIGTGHFTSIYHTCVAKAGVTKFTLTVSGASASQLAEIRILEFSGVAATSCFDQKATATPFTGTNPTAPALTPSVDKELSIAFFVQTATSVNYTTTGQNGYTFPANTTVSDPNSNPGALGYKVLSGTGATTPGATSTQNVTHGTYHLLLKPGP